MSAPPRKAKSILHFTFQELVEAYDKLLVEIEERDATIKRLQASHREAQSTVSTTAGGDAAGITAGMLDWLTRPDADNMERLAAARIEELSAKNARLDSAWTAMNKEQAKQWQRAEAAERLAEQQKEDYDRAERDAAAFQDDLAQILRAVGLSDGARPYSPRECVQRDLLPHLHKLALAEQRGELLCKMREWLDNHTTFYDADNPPNVPTLAQVSNRIWYHATDNTQSYPFSAVIDAALSREPAQEHPGEERK